MLVNISKLVDLPLFSGLTAKQISIFVTAIGCITKKFDKGAYIMRAFESNDYIWVMLSGKSQIVVEDQFGNETSGHLLEKGYVMGATSAIVKGEYNFSSIEAVTEIEVLIIPYAKLIQMGPSLGQIHGIVMKNLLEAFSMKRILMMEKLELVSQKSLRRRIMIYLSQQSRHQKTDVLQVPGRVQMAKVLSCNRSALTREIGLMEEEGIIETGKGWMKVIKEVDEVK